jgi:hypothetical protein
MPRNLTTASTIQCPHLGVGLVLPKNTKVSIDGNPLLLETDVHLVLGCTFTLPGPKPSPCIKIEWSAGASKVKINGVKVLTETSVGKCTNAEQAPQGTAIVQPNQLKVSSS